MGAARHSVKLFHELMEKPKVEERDLVPDRVYMTISIL